jgi:ferredoxin like protein
MSTIEERLALDKYALDENSHITINQEICSQCVDRYCLTVCPAQVYRCEEGEGTVVVNHAGCLECGSCIAVCELGSLTWNMPAGGMGVIYRYA